MNPVKLPVRVPPCVRVEIDEDLHRPRHLRRRPHRLCEVGGPKPIYIYIIVFVMGLLILNTFNAGHRVWVCMGYVQHVCVRW